MLVSVTIIILIHARSNTNCGLLQCMDGTYSGIYNVNGMPIRVGIGSTVCR